MRWTHGAPRAAALAITVLCAGGLARTAHAQPKPADAAPRPLSESLSGEAKQSYDGAVLLYSDNDLKGAAEKFTRAYELSKDPRLLWNMATCEKGLRHYFRTYQLIDRYLKEGASSLSMEQVARAEETKRTLGDLYSPVTLRVEPAQARVTADGAPLEPGATGAMGLDLGLHKVHVQAEGFEPQDLAVDAPGRTPVEIKVTLKRVVAPARLSVVTENTATITVDGRPSTGQWEGALAPGHHKVQVTSPGKVPYFTELDLGEGQNRSMLVPLKEKAGIPLWVWIGGGVLLAGGAALAIVGVVRANEQPPPLAGKLGTINLSSW